VGELREFEKNESRRNLTVAEGVFTRVGDIQKAIFVLVLLVQLAHRPARMKVSNLKLRNRCEQSGQLIERFLDICTKKTDKGYLLKLVTRNG